MPAFSFAHDGNVSVGFTADSPLGVLTLSLEYSTSPTFGSGTSIVSNLNLNNLGTTGPWRCTAPVFPATIRTCSIDWNPSGASDGNYFINAQLSVFLLGVSTNSTDHNFMMDNSAPTTSWDGSSSWVNDPATITLSCSSSGAGCSTTEYRIDSDTSSNISFGSWTTYSSPLSVSADGNTTLEFRSTDALSNVESVVRRHVLLDTALPSISIISPEAEENVNPTASFSYSGSDALSGIQRYEVSLDGENWTNKGTSTSHLFTGLPPGSNTFYVRLFDEAGNVDSASVSVNRPGIHTIGSESFDTGDFTQSERWDSHKCSIQDSVSKTGSYSLVCDAWVANPDIDYDPANMEVDLGPFLPDANLSIWMRASSGGDASFHLLAGNTNKLVVAVNSMQTGYLQFGTSTYPDTDFSSPVAFDPDQWYLYRIFVTDENTFDIYLYDSDGTTLLGSALDFGDATNTDRVMLYSDYGYGYYDEVPYDHVD